MLVFDVKCRVLEPVTLTDFGGTDVTIGPGTYHLRGVDNLVRSVGQNSAAGTEICFMREGDEDIAYRVSAQNLAHFIALDEVEVAVAGRETP